MKDAFIEKLDCFIEDHKSLFIDFEKLNKRNELESNDDFILYKKINSDDFENTIQLNDLSYHLTNKIYLFFNYATESSTITTHGHNKKKKNCLYLEAKKNKNISKDLKNKNMFFNFLYFIASSKKRFSTLKKQEIEFLLKYYLNDQLEKNSYFLSFLNQYSCDVCGYSNNIYFNIFEDNFEIKSTECFYPNGFTEYKENIKISSGKLLCFSNLEDSFKAAIMISFRQNPNLPEIHIDTIEGRILKSYNFFQHHIQAKKKDLSEDYLKHNVSTSFLINNSLKYVSFSINDNLISLTLNNEKTDSNIKVNRTNIFTYMDKTEFLNLCDVYKISIDSFHYQEINVDNGIYVITKDENLDNNLISIKKK